MTSSNYCLLPPEMTVGKVNNNVTSDGVGSKYAGSRTVGSAGSHRSSRMGSAGSSKASDSVSFFLTHRPNSASHSNSINQWRGPPGSSTSANQGGALSNANPNADSRFSSNIDLPHLGLRLNVPGYKEEYGGSEYGAANRERRRAGSARPATTGRAGATSNRNRDTRGRPPTAGSVATTAGRRYAGGGVSSSSVFDSIPDEVVEGESYLQHLRDKMQGGGGNRQLSGLEADEAHGDDGDGDDDQDNQDGAGFSLLDEWQQFCLDHLSPPETEKMLKELETGSPLRAQRPPPPQEESGVEEEEEASRENCYRKVFDYFVQHGEGAGLKILRLLREQQEQQKQQGEKGKTEEQHVPRQPTPNAEALDDVPPPSGDLNPTTVTGPRVTMADPHQQQDGETLTPRVQRTYQQHASTNSSASAVMVPTHLVRKPQVSSNLNSRRNHLANLMLRPPPAGAQHEPQDQQPLYNHASAAVEHSNQQKLQVAHHAREVLASCHAHHVQMKHVSVLRSQQRAASATNRLFHRHSTTLKAPILRRRTTREEEGPGLAPSMVPVSLGTKPVNPRVSSATTRNKQQLEQKAAAEGQDLNFGL